MKYIFVVNSNDAQPKTIFSECEQEIAKSILKFVEQIYKICGIFFPDKKIIIQKAPTAPCPRFCMGSKNNFTNDCIIITTENLSYWCQAMFQISHEMTHAGIQYNSSSESESVSWIEETICEAMSLFFLKKAVYHWEEIKPNWFNESYKNNVDDYLKNALSESGTDELSKCKSLKILKRIDENSQDNRATRKNEMHKLLSHIKGKNIKGLINYRKYIMRNTILLNTKKYRRDFCTNEAVTYMCDLQDKIIAPWKARLYFIGASLTNLMIRMKTI